MSSEPKRPAKLLTPEQRAQIEADEKFWRTLPISRIPRSPFKPTVTADEVVSRYLASRSFEDYWRGRTILITGVGPDGIGAPTAAAFARLPDVTIILAVRNPSNAEPVKSTILASSSCRARRIEIVALDNTSFASVRALASSLGNRPLHALVLNAGIMASSFQLTEDGHESQFQTNHLSHFLLATLLRPALEAASTDQFTPRVISVSSLAHKGGGINWNDPDYLESKENYPKWLAYDQTKTANILFTREWYERYGRLGRPHRVIAHSLHPGIIPTRLQRDLPLEEQKKLGWIDTKTGKWKSFVKTIEQGAATTVYVALAPELADVDCSGYFEDVSITPGFTPHPLCGMSRRWIFDDAEGKAAEKLWAMSEEMTKTKTNQLKAKL